MFFSRFEVSLPQEPMFSRREAPVARISDPHASDSQKGQSGGLESRATDWRAAGAAETLCAFARLRREVWEKNGTGGTPALLDQAQFMNKDPVLLSLMRTCGVSAKPPI